MNKVKPTRTSIRRAADTAFNVKKFVASENETSRASSIEGNSLCGVHGKKVGRIKTNVQRVVRNGCHTVAIVKISENEIAI